MVLNVKEEARVGQKTESAHYASMSSVDSIDDDGLNCCYRYALEPFMAGAVVARLYTLSGPYHVAHGTSRLHHITRFGLYAIQVTQPRASGARILYVNPVRVETSTS